MTKLINKLINQGQEYLLAGGGKEGDKIEYVTEQEYEALTPEQKSDEDITYMITGEGEPVPPTPTPGVVSDIILGEVGYPCFKDGYYISTRNASANDAIIHKNNGTLVKDFQGDKKIIYVDKKLYAVKGTTSSNLKIFDMETLTSETFEIEAARYLKNMKINNNGVFFYYEVNTDKYYKLIDGSFIEITSEEYNNEKDYSNSNNGLFYSQDGEDYVAKDIDGNEVKRYEGVGTISGIANGKLYRAVSGVNLSVAIATI